VAVVDAAAAVSVFVVGATGSIAVGAGVLLAFGADGADAANVVDAAGAGGALTAGDGVWTGAAIGLTAGVTRGGEERTIFTWWWRSR
jgi:hypothetical protein